ncbi:hypothetical protein ABZ297_05075 [Nonomuraea sp. NPDC005983]|uniref:hypothetical protein n=1 Tax=Nonomuraea sp. NPDC005983 TaxID=3155595 RepID=UPI0033B7FF6A
MLVEISVNVSTPAGGERVDAVVSWGIKHGLHRVAALDSALDVAAGWRVELPGGTVLRVDGPGGMLFDGAVTLAPGWRQAVTFAHLSDLTSSVSSLCDHHQSQFCREKGEL